MRQKCEVLIRKRREVVSPDYFQNNQSKLQLFGKLIVFYLDECFTELE